MKIAFLIPLLLFTSCKLKSEDEKFMDQQYNEFKLLVKEDSLNLFAKTSAENVALLHSDSDKKKEAENWLYKFNLHMDQLNERIRIKDSIEKYNDSIVKAPEQAALANKARELKQFMTVNNDEFNNTSWVYPKSRPYYRNSNGLYCYFAKANGVVNNFRFVIQYVADDWLFIERYRFIIDGKSYTYTPISVERDNDNGLVWEWSDEILVTETDIELIEAIANAKTAKIRFEGSQYHNDRNISATQIKSIKQTLEYYKTLGGTL